MILARPIKGYGMGNDPAPAYDAEGSPIAMLEVA